MRRDLKAWQLAFLDKILLLFRLNKQHLMLHKKKNNNLKFPLSANFKLIYTLGFATVLLGFSTCKQESECNADFSLSYLNGGMAPETVILSASKDDQDSYEWDVDGLTYNDTPSELDFASRGSFNVDLNVNNGDKSCEGTDVIDIRDYPYQGFVAANGEEMGRVISYFLGDGSLNTRALDNIQSIPRVVPDGAPLNLDGTGGLDYNNRQRRLYVTPNYPNGNGITFINSFPNGLDVNNFNGQDDFGIFDMEIDELNNIAYYSIRFGGNAVIKKANLNSSDIQEEVFHNSFEFGNIYFSIDFDKNKAFYTTQNSIVTLNDAGQIEGQSSYGATDSELKYATVLDPINGLLYYSQWSDADQVHNIFRVDPADFGNEGVALIPINEAPPEGFPIEGLDIDHRNQELFWSDKNCGCIKRLNLRDLTDLTIVVANLDDPRAIAVGVFDKE